MAGSGSLDASNQTWESEQQAEELDRLRAQMAEMKVATERQIAQLKGINEREFGALRYVFRGAPVDAGAGDADEERKPQAGRVVQQVKTGVIQASNN